MAFVNDVLSAVVLGADINKQKSDITPETKEGIVSEKLPELTLEMKDDEILKLTNKWRTDWDNSPAKAEWLQKCDENENYWLGKQYDQPAVDKQRAQVDNLIFESLETYLPQVTRRNPEPLVTLDNSEDSTTQKQEYVLKLKNRLGDLADKNKLRLKLKRTARYWGIYLLGVVKYGWGMDGDIPVVRALRPKKLILDPDAVIDEDGYNGNRIGEYRRLEASTIISIMGDIASAESKKYINDQLKDNMGTMLQFIEWWTPQYMCWELDKHILLKRKNPHWNYDSNQTNEVVDDYGNTTQQEEEVKGINHFPASKMPYDFLVVFNIGDRPMDNTSLIGQNLANQDLINKRNKQIDKNADKANNGCIVSLERSGLTQSQAKTVSDAVRKGGTVTIPAGSAQEAIYFPVVNALPGDVYNQLVDTRNRMRDIFGTRGSSAAGITSEKTVRGKIISRGLDTDRIGGGISEYLEQLADNVYNWVYQLLLVYDTGYQFAQGVTPPKVVISVKEGSLLPKDSTTIANQAIELGAAGKLSLIDMYKRLEWPNPEEVAANVWLEKNAPELLYQNNPLVTQAITGMQQAKMEEAKMKVLGEQVKTNQDIQVEKAKADAKAEADIKTKRPAVPEGGESLLTAVPQNEALPQQ